QAQVYQKEDRLEFQIHGHEGPNSYRYGYDTGHGYNRQFRYEEKDKDGMVHGRYGYFDPYGKLHVVNYSSHPEHGYKASGDGLPTR
ncbi:Putative LOC101741297, partial [Caligus rogercresseyi]